MPRLGGDGCGSVTLAASSSADSQEATWTLPAVGDREGGREVADVVAAAARGGEVLAVLMTAPIGRGCVGAGDCGAGMEPVAM
jgi:hypothetical protein